MAVTNNDIRDNRLAYIRDAERALGMLRTEIVMSTATDVNSLYIGIDVVLDALKEFKGKVIGYHAERECAAE